MLQIFGWTVGFTIVTILVTYHIFKPVDKRLNLFGKTYKLPPGPSGVPVFGNLFQFRAARKPGQIIPWLGSMRQYGDMTTLHLGSQTWILLNSKQAADDLINKNGRVTNERPYMPIASGLVSNGKRTVIRQTKEWQEGRRVMHHLLSGSELKKYGSWQELVSLELLSSYLKEPERWYAHHYRYSLAVLYRVVMGDPLTKSKAELDAFQQIGMEFVRSIAQSMIDFFPALDKLPKLLQPWRAYWRDMGARHRAIFVDWWSDVHAEVQQGTARPSFVRDTLLHPDMKYKGDGEEAMYLATSVIGAGGDNTRMSLNTFIMAMVSNLDVFKKARVEIDELCGGEDLRLPGIADIDDLPYVSAIIKEVLRWRPTVPLVPPHQLSEDLVYKGYRLPKGTCIVVNNVAISMEFEDWDTFDPRRWIDGTQNNVVANHWGFGGGRRICVGYRVAQQALFIAIARLIFCFDLTPGGPIDTKALNHVSLEEPFPVKVQARSLEHQALIERDLARAVRADER